MKRRSMLFRPCNVIYSEYLFVSIVLALPHINYYHYHYEGAIRDSRHPVSTGRERSFRSLRFKLSALEHFLVGEADHLLT